MKTLLTIAAAAAFAAGAAFAQPTELTFVELDVNEDGQLSIEEVQAVAPNVTQEDFDAFDADGDGFLQEPEFDTWLAVYAGSQNDDPDGDDGDDPMEG